MATKQIPELTPTNTANDTDLAMIRQGVEDKKVEIQYIRDRGSAVGKTMTVGEFGLGDFSKLITDYYGSDDANVIDRTGYYQVSATTANVPAEGVLIHSQRTSGSEAAQILLETTANVLWFRRRNVSWNSWEKPTLASNNLSDLNDSPTARTNLGLGTAATYNVGTAAGQLPTVGNNDAKYLIKASNLSDLTNTATARTNLSVYSKSEADGKYPTKANNLSDLANAATARTNLSVYSKAEADGKYAFRTNNLSDLSNVGTARTNLSVYSKTETDAAYLAKSNDLSDLNSVSVARTNLSVYSKSEADAKYAFRSNNLSDLANAATARTNLGLGTAATRNVGTAATNLIVVSDADVRYYNESNNLSEIAAGVDAATKQSEARTNLSVYSKSETDGKYAHRSNNLSDLASAATARTNLSVYSKTETDTAYLAKSSNLNDLPNKPTARTNLGLGTAAVVNTGTAAGEVPTTSQADARYLNETNNLSDLSSASTARTNLDVYSKSQVDAAIQALYPVGSIFMTTSSTNPATQLGFGSWSKYAQGRTIVGEGSLTDTRGETRILSEGETGGEFRHAMTAAENGPHTHNNSLNDPGHRHNIKGNSGGDGGSTQNDGLNNTVQTETALTGITLTNASSGSGSPHNNMQPYIVTYIWVRTA